MMPQVAQLARALLQALSANRNTCFDCAAHAFICFRQQPSVCVCAIFLPALAHVFDPQSASGRAAAATMLLLFCFCFSSFSSVAIAAADACLLLLLLL